MILSAVHDIIFRIFVVVFFQYLMLYQIECFFNINVKLVRKTAQSEKQIADAIYKLAFFLLHNFNPFFFRLVTQML